MCFKMYKTHPKKKKKHTPISLSMKKNVKYLNNNFYIDYMLRLNFRHIELNKYIKINNKFNIKYILNLICDILNLIINSPVSLYSFNVLLEKV